MPISTAYKLFQRLCDTTEIRHNSRADRDRKLYDEFRVKLGMAQLKPAAFFSLNPQVSEAKVFATFLDIMEPFARMLDLIYNICSRTKRGGTGGKDLVIQYDFHADSLRFDLKAFMRYRRIRESVRFTGTIPMYHSDYVPGYAMTLKRMAKGPPFQWWSNTAAGPVPTLNEFLDLLSRAKLVGLAHLNLLDAVMEKLSEAPSGGKEFQTWLKSVGVSGEHLPYSAEQIPRWRSLIKEGLASLAEIRAKKLFQTLSGDERKQTVDSLKRMLAALATVQELQGWRESVEKWLELPYWKKRWQVYEVWAVGLCLRAVLEVGGVLNPDNKGQLVLRTGASREPLATLGLNVMCKLEVWFEFPLPSAADPKFRPDIVIALRTGTGRVPLHFVECKQRATERLSRTLRDACKYVDFMPSGSEHLLINYDSWGVSPLRESSKGRGILAVGEARPGGAGLEPIERFLFRIFGGGQLWAILVDTTSSMAGKIPRIAECIRNLKANLDGATPIWLVLFGDHKDIYTVRFHLDSDEPEQVADALLAAPLTHGDDEPEAHEDALHFLRKKLRKEGWRAARITLFSDARSHTPVECPHGYDFENEIQMLLKGGHQLTLVSCDREPHNLGWDALPGVKTVTLDAFAS